MSASILSLSASQQAGLFVFVVLIAYVGKALLAALRGPLANVPGPLLNKVTVLPLKLATVSGRRPMYIDKLVKQYGPFVQIAPDEVNVNDLTAVKQVHRIGAGFQKTKWYSHFTGEGGYPGIFAMTDPKEHAARRRMFARQFSKNGIIEYEHSIKSKLSLAMNTMAKHATGDKVDLMLWFALFASDLVSDLCFGDGFHALEQGKTSQYILDLQQTAFIGGIRAEFPRLMNVLLKTPLPFATGMQDSERRMLETGMKAYSSYTRAEQLGTAPKTFFSGITDKVTDDQASAESRNFLIAGSDTTMTTLAYTVYNVLKHRQVHEKLMGEISQLESEYTIDDIEKLPYLDNVVQESLRLFGAAPGSLPRAVPKGGATLGPYFFPENTTVSTQAWSLHRDPSIFPDPLRFNPERWETATQDMKDAFVPFGLGTRICLGQHLARIELLMGTADFFRTFPSAYIPHETTDASMEPEVFFLIAPKSHKCIIGLGKVQS